MSDQNQVQRHPSNMFKLLYLSIATLLNFTGFNGAQSILAKVYEQLQFNNLGRYCFITLYLCFSLTNLVAPKIVSATGIKLCLIVSTFGYFLSLAAGVITSSCQKFMDSNLFYCQERILIYIINIVFNAITGISAGVVWNSYLKYVSNITNENNKGKFFGIFYSFQSSSTLTGNLLTVILFNYTDKFNYFFVLSSFCLGSFVMLWFLPPDNTKYTRDSLLSQDLRENEQLQQQQEQQATTRETINKIIDLAKQKRIRPLFYVFFLKGIVVSFYTGFLFKIVDLSRPQESDEQRNKYLGIVLLTAGIASLISGQIIGKLFDRLRRQRMLSLVNIIVQFSLVASLIAYFQQSYTLCFVASAFWGLSTCTLATVISSLIAKDFDGSLSGFALNLLIVNAGTVVGFFLQIIMNSYDPIYYMFIIIVIQAIAGSEMVLYKNKKLLPEDTTKST